MADRALPIKRRLQVLVKESTCPGLISDLNLVPEGDENVFVRAVLSEWFAANSLQGNVAEAVSILVEKYRLVEFGNANGIKLRNHDSGGGNTSIEHLTSSAPGGKEQPSDASRSRSKPEIRVAAHLDLGAKSEPTIASVATPVVAPASTVISVPTPAQYTPSAVTSPSHNEVDFDPDQF